MWRKCVLIKKKYFIIYAIILIVGLTFGVDRCLKIVYPIHYEEYVMKYSKEYDIDPYLVFSIIKAESKFFPYAESNRVLEVLCKYQILLNSGLVMNLK